jgi:hypothetical protein
MSNIFSTNKYQEISAKVKEILNAEKDFLSSKTARSPRAVGDALENIISEKFQTIVSDICSDYSSDFARRAMADFAFNDKEGNYYIIDVKTHREDTSFNMPNLTSVKRLARFYEDDKNYFCLLLIRYSIEQNHVNISEVTFVPIEFMSWNCLTLGALGWGQIQIANSNYITINTELTRKKWMLNLCDVLLEFYPKEILKINERITFFEKVREYWLEK